MKIKSELSSFANRIPKEHILKPLIESDTLDVLVVGAAEDNYDYKMLWEALKVYCCCYGRNIKLHFAEEFEADESLKRILHFYELENYVEFIREADEETRLCYYLGCDFALFLGESDKAEESLLKAQYFQLPILAINALEGIQKQEDVLQVSSNPAEVAAAFHVLKNHPDYRKRLSIESRQKIKALEEEK